MLQHPHASGGKCDTKAELVLRVGGATRLRNSRDRKLMLVMSGAVAVAAVATSAASAAAVAAALATQSFGSLPHAALSTCNENSVTSI